MSKREMIAREVGRLSEADLDRLLAFLHAPAEQRADASVPLMAAEPALAKDWLSPDEDAAWANL
jgi:hypothetical protein